MQARLEILMLEDSADGAICNFGRGRGTACEPEVVDACLTLFMEKAHVIRA